MSNFWKYTSFWDRITKTLALLGPSGGVVVGKYTEDPFWGIKNTSLEYHLRFCQLEGV